MEFNSQILQFCVFAYDIRVNYKADKQAQCIPSHLILQNSEHLKL
jgi:hypothetical protein